MFASPFFFSSVDLFIRLSYDVLPMHTLRICLVAQRQEIRKNTSALHEFNRSTKWKLIDSPFLSRNRSGSSVADWVSEWVCAKHKQRATTKYTVALCVCAHECIYVYIWAKSVVPLFQYVAEWFCAKILMPLPLLLLLYFLQLVSLSLSLGFLHCSTNSVCLLPYSSSEAIYLSF